MSNSSVLRRPPVNTHKFQRLQPRRTPPTLRAGIPLHHHIPSLHRGSLPESALFMLTLTSLGADQSTSLPCFLLHLRRQRQAGSAKFTLLSLRKLTLSLSTGYSNGYTRTGLCSRKKMTQDRPWRALAQVGVRVGSAREGLLASGTGKLSAIIVPWTTTS
jgi:hypothetical protein